jgi:hypothetical protein
MAPESKKPLASSPARGFRYSAWPESDARFQAHAGNQRVGCSVSITRFRGIAFFLRKKRFVRTTGRAFCSREFALSINFLGSGFLFLKRQRAMQARR